MFNKTNNTRNKNNCKYKALILKIDPLYKYINNNNPVLCLTKQIIQEIKIIVNREIEPLDNLILTLCLKKNNY
jgi:hypothetical protein